MNPAAGWYDDPMDQSLIRYWDGTQFTEHTAQKPTPVINVPSNEPSVFEGQPSNVYRPGEHTVSNEQDTHEEVAEDTSSTIEALVELSQHRELTRRERRELERLEAARDGQEEYIPEDMREVSETELELLKFAAEQELKEHQENKNSPDNLSLT